jgi:phosphoserine phosphatase RsbU/P
VTDAELFEQAACGLVTTSMEGVITRVNATFLAQTGFTAPDVVGKKWPSLLAGGARVYYETHYAPLLHMQGFVREIAVDIVCADGGRLPVLANSVVHDKTVHTAVFLATDRREYERELLRERERARVLAETLQQTFIPPAPPAVPGLDVAGVYRPAGAGDEVGGDFYDVFATGADDWGVVVGDVCGKGAEAAVVTALARYTVRATAMQAPSPSYVLGALNEALLRADAGRFCTVVYGRLERALPAWRLTVASGGHPLPYLVRGEGEVAAVGRPGSLLGILSPEEMVAPSDHVVLLSPGDSVVFFTDGVIEARGEGDALYGEERLRELLGASASMGAGEMAGAVVDAVLGYQGGVARDDIAVVVVRVPA